MKIHLFFLFFLPFFYFTNNLNAQTIDIPDPGFKNALLNYTNRVDTNGDGEIQIEEALKVEKLNLKGYTIKNLKGIEYFVNLYYLECSSNYITEMDISKLTKLEILSCSSNQLSELNISELTKLKILSCSSNQLSELNISNLTKLTELYCNNNQLTNLDVSNLVNLEKISCTKNQLSELNISNLSKLRDLYCASNQLTSLNVSYSPNLNQLYCDNNKISELDISKLSNLIKLSCTNNLLSNLNLSNLSKLTYLYCDNNQLNNLNLSQTNSLTELYCINNQLTSLNTSELANLSILYCENNQLNTLNITNNSNLKFLKCQNNKIKYLNTSKLISLQTINCENNLLSDLDFSNSIYLHTIRCNKNQLTNLNVSNTQLTHLFCNDNQLSTLDLSNLKSLVRVDCYNNQITNLGIINSTVNLELFCRNNQLTTIDLSNIPNLETLSCDDNLITKLDTSKNPLLEKLYCDNNLIKELDISFNPELNRFEAKNNNSLERVNLKGTLYEKGFLNSSLSKNPNLKYICINPEHIETFKIFLFSTGISKDVLINSYCSFSPGGVYYTLKGENKLNLDNDACTSATEYYPNLKIIIEDTKSTDKYISDNSGKYTLYLSKGKYTLTPEPENPDYFSVSPSNLSIDTSTITDPSEVLVQNFCLTPKGEQNDLDITLIPINAARPGFESKYKIIYKNKGNTTLSGTVQLQFPNLVSFVSSMPTYSSSNTQNLEWNYADLKPFESREIQVTFRVSPPPIVNIGNQLSYHVKITPVENDKTEEDNVFNLEEIVVGSYDPNDKTCLEGNTITPDMVGNYIHYLIRFENTGTYYAENVVVKDIIDNSKFDISTLQITDSSHPQTTKIKGNTVEFIFEGIKLPHTEPDKHGYIAFKIKTNSNLSVGDKLKNQANIFFDYNLPITTNESITSVKTTMGTDEINISENKLVIYPNPVKDILYFSTKFTIKKAEIYDLNGKLIATYLSPDNQFNVKTLPSNTYIIKFYSDKGNKIQTKFIKQ